MLIQKEKTQYYEYALSFDYDQDIVEYCRYLKSVLGWTEFNYDHENKRWRWKDPKVIKMLKDKFPVVQFGEGLEKEIEKQNLAQEKVKEIKEMKVSTLEIKGIKGELYNYQKLGVEFFVNSGGRGILADSPGVGKSAQALGYVVHENLKRTLVICPASVKFSWENEIKKWTKLKSFIVEPKTKFSDISHDVNIVIVNYDMLKKYFNELMKYGWNCLIGDEIQYIKSSNAIRSKAFKVISENIPKVIMLSGTPLLSAPIEMFNMLNIVDEKIWNNWYSYAVKYCGGRQGQWGFETKGATRLEELKQKIEKYFLRRTKEEVLTELPPKNFINVPMELSKHDRDRYKMVEDNLVKYLREHKNKKDKEIIKVIQAEKLVRLNFLREINTLGKISITKELINGFLDAKEKILVFSSFNSPLIELSNLYKENSVMIIGSTPVNKRGEIVKKFQEDPNIKIFFGGTLSSGTGITLTAASNIIVMDYPWRPADIEQLINRAHRPGAIYECLNIYQIISKNSIDDFMQKLLKKKQEIIDQLIGGEIIHNTENMIDDYIEELKLKYKEK